MIIYRVKADASTRILSPLALKTWETWLRFTGTSLRARWPAEPPKFKWLKAEPIEDFINVEATHIACSQRAVDALGEALTEYVELLPIRVKQETYFILNPLCVTDGLDWKRSDLRWHSENVLGRVQVHEFIPARIKDALFVLPKSVNSHLYCAEPAPKGRPDFLQAVRERGLTGLELVEVWNPEGTAKPIGRMERVNHLVKPKRVTKARGGVASRTPLVAPDGAFSYEHAGPWFKRAVERDLKPRVGEMGEQSPWLLVGQIQLTSSSLLISDAAMICDESDRVELGVGIYRFEVRYILYGDEWYVGGVRIIKTGSEPERGKRVAKIGIDTAACGFADAQHIETLDDDERELYEKATERELWDNLQDWKVLAPKKLKGLQVVCVRSGFGDGDYPCWELVRERKRVGVEVEFLKATQKYEGFEDGVA